MGQTQLPSSKPSSWVHSSVGAIPVNGWRCPAHIKRKKRRREKAGSSFTDRPAGNPGPSCVSLRPGGSLQACACWRGAPQIQRLLLSCSAASGTWGPSKRAVQKCLVFLKSGLVPALWHCACRIYTVRAISWPNSKMIGWHMAKILFNPTLPLQVQF